MSVIPWSRALSPGQLPAPAVSQVACCLCHSAVLALTRGSLLQKRSTRMNILGSQSPLHPSTLSTGKRWHLGLIFLYINKIKELPTLPELHNVVQAQSAARKLRPRKSGPRVDLSELSGQPLCVGPRLPTFLCFLQ